MYGTLNKSTPLLTVNRALSERLNVVPRSIICTFVVHFFLSTAKSCFCNSKIVFLANFEIHNSFIRWLRSLQSNSIIIFIFMETENIYIFFHKFILLLKGQTIIRIGIEKLWRLPVLPVCWGVILPACQPAGFAQRLVSEMLR